MPAALSHCMWATSWHSLDANFFLPLCCSHPSSCSVCIHIASNYGFLFINSAEHFARIVGSRFHLMAATGLCTYCSFDIIGNACGEWRSLCQYKFYECTHTNASKCFPCKLAGWATFSFPQKARDKLKCHNLFIEKYPRVYIHFYTFFHSELTQAQILTLFSSHFVFIWNTTPNSPVSIVHK